MIVDKVENLLEKESIKKYKAVVMRMLPLNFTSLQLEEIEEAVDYSINKRFKNNKARIYNNYTERTLDTTLLDVMEYIIKREPIICASGVMFKKHSECRNPLINLITSYLTNRKKAKKKMFTFPKGSEDFEKYNLLQLLYKIDTNSIYGCLGQYSCILYNLHVAPSITTMARSCISSAGLLFESILANNCKFENLNEVITFIDNVRQEKEERIFADSDILDHDVDVDDCFVKVMDTCGFNYIPTQKDMDIIYEILYNMSQEDLNRVYYKNNLYMFMDNQYITDLFIKILKKLDKPFLNPNDPPECVIEELNEFLGLMMEYVYYHHHIIDRVDKYANMVRKICVITDTDSTMISLDAFYRYWLAKVKDIDLKIKKEKFCLFDFIDIDEFGDEKKKPLLFDIVEDEADYDFYEDEIVYYKKQIDLYSVIPQESLRYSIINIISYCLTHIVNDYMVRYTKNIHSYAEDRTCLVDMKNEFLFKTILLTNVKKNYASIQELQEGNVIKGGYMDIKGLAMNKSITNTYTQKRLKQIMYDEVLSKGENFDQIGLLKKLAVFEKDIINKLRSGDKSLYKPRKIKPYDSYADPLRISGIRPSLVWNEMRDDGIEGIDLTETNSIDIVNTVINIKTVERLKDKALEFENNGDHENYKYFMSKYEKLKSLLYEERFGAKINKKNRIPGSINGVALPSSVAPPEWLLEFIDYNKIVNDSLSLFPLEPLDIFRGNKKNNYTNIMSF